MSLKKLVTLDDEFLSEDRRALIGIRERRNNEGSAKNPPKGRLLIWGLVPSPHGLG
jgi:hypothetical protein